MITFFATLVQHPLVLLFFLVNLGIVLGIHLRVKNHSFENHALAGRSLPTAVLLMTLLGTTLSSGHFAFAGWVAKYGVLHFMGSAFIVGLFLLVGTFLAPCLVYFPNMKTTGDLMKHFYGRAAQVFTGVVSNMLSIIMISGQLKGIGLVSKHFLHIEDPFVPILLVGSLVIMHSAWGGMRAIVYSDGLKMIMAFVMISFLVKVAMQKVGGVAMLVERLPESHSAFLGHPFFRSMLTVRLLTCLMPNFIVFAPIMQRMLISNKKQVRQMWYLGAFMLFILFGMLKLITLSAFAIGVEVDASSTESVTTLFLRAVSFLVHRGWILDFIYISILAVAISTLDSFLHATGVSIVQDFVTPFREILGMRSLRSKDKTFVSRLGIITVGIGALLLSYVSGPSLEFINLSFWAEIPAPMLVLPLILGIIGLKTDQKSWLSFCAVYVISGGVLYGTGWYAHTSLYHRVSIALFFALLAYFAMHLYLNRGIVFFKRGQDTASERVWLPTLQGLGPAIARWLSQFTRLPYLAQTEVIKGRPTQSLGFSIALFFLYALSSVVGQRGGEGLPAFMAIIHFIGIVLCCGLMFEELWPHALKHYFSLYWLISLFYCLPFGATLTFLKMHEGRLSLLFFLGSFMLLSLLVSSRALLWMSTVGLLLPHIGWYMVVGALPLDLSSHWQAYAALLGILLCVFCFGHRAEQYVENRLYVNRTLSNALYHEANHHLHKGISGVPFFIDKVNKSLVPITKAGKKGFFLPEKMKEYVARAPHQILETLENIDQEFTRFKSLIKADVFSPSKEKVSIKALIKAAIPKVIKRYEGELKIKITCKKNFVGYIPDEYFDTVLDNIARNARFHGGATKLHITIDGHNRTIHMRDNGSGIPPAILPRIFELDASTREERKGGVGLALVDLILAVAGIKIKCFSRHGDKKSYAEFVLVFPEQ